jgi:hypothetical protein
MGQMSEKWMAVENFERAHEIISAVNTLSIHTKLALAGMDDRIKPNDQTTPSVFITVNSQLISGSFCSNSNSG